MSYHINLYIITGRSLPIRSISTAKKRTIMSTVYATQCKNTAMVGMYMCIYMYKMDRG